MVSLGGGLLILHGRCPGVDHLRVVLRHQLDQTWREKQRHQMAGSWSADRKFQ